MKELLFVCNLIISVVGICYFHHSVLKVISFFFTKKFPKTDVCHKYAVLIPARNEETVIKNLIESINRQEYPKELVTVFVVADNCTDGTAAAARESGAVCYERFDGDRRTKGFALEYLLDCIERDYGIESFEGYFVFDADNLLKKDFISRMNDAFHSGAEVITSYRNTKNIDDNSIASGYAMHWLRTTRLESRGRALLGISTRLQGTGYLFAARLVKEGWHYTTLTEDREFTADLIQAGVTISYQSEAEFYDEQPVSLRIALRQRIRWGKGHLMAFRMFFFKLWRCVFKAKGWQKKLSAFDFQVTNFPYCIFMVPLQILSAVLTFATATAATPWYSLLFRILSILFIGKLKDIPLIAAVAVVEYKRTKKVKWWRYVLYCITFPLFTVMGDLATWIALFSHVTWKPIPHKADIKISEIEEVI